MSFQEKISVHWRLAMNIEERSDTVQRYYFSGDRICICACVFVHASVGVCMDMRVCNMCGMCL